MKKRFKWLLRALFWVRTSVWACRGLKIQPRAKWTGFLAILVLILTPFSTVQADDHKTRVVTFLSSGVKTAAISQSSSFDVSAYAEGQIFIDVTAEAGTSTLDVVVQTSPDNSSWYTHTTVAQITATGQTRTAVTNFGNYMRIYYTVGGTSMTFSVVGVFKN